MWSFDQKELYNRGMSQRCHITSQLGRHFLETGGDWLHWPKFAGTRKVEVIGHLQYSSNPNERHGIA